ncbi:MAG: permease, partial [Candidatus Deferrimicrobiota bacterium]
GTGHGRAGVFLAKAWELTLKTGKFTLLGVAIGVLAERYIPREWIAGYLGEGSVKNVLLVTLFSVPLHVNEITAAAILYSLLELGLAKGPALAFLIGGPVTSIPAMSVLLTMCRKRVVATFLAICICGTLILALGFQFLVSRYPAIDLLFEYAK